MTKPLRNLVKILLLPQVLPRSARLFSGLDFIPSSLASSLTGLKLLPPGYQYQEEGIVALMASAARYCRGYRDKSTALILFIGFLVLVVAVIVVSVAIALISPAAAGEIKFPSSSMFFSQNPEDDIAYILLDRTFGIKGFTGSCVEHNTPCLGAIYSDGNFPALLSVSLRVLLGYYAKGLLGIGGVLFTYHTTTLIMETARSGKPFGTNFHAMSVLRIMIGVGLLLPAGQGLCGAQWVGLYAAKYGSGFASNAWSAFVRGSHLTATNTLVGDASTLIGMPNLPAANETVEFVATARVCQVAYEMMYRKKIEAYLLPAPLSIETLTLEEAFHSFNTTYKLQQYSGGSSLQVAFGEYDPVRYASERGKVHPYCGTITFSPPRMINPDGYDFYDGGDYISYSYLKNLVLFPWNVNDKTDLVKNGVFQRPYFDKFAEKINQVYLFNNHTVTLPTNDDKSNTLLWYKTFVEDIVYDGYRAETEEDLPTILGTVRPLNWLGDEDRYGWAGAGIWYNRLMTENNIFSASVATLPEVGRYPIIMELVKQERQKASPYTPGDSPFDPNLPNGKNLIFPEAKEQQIIQPMNASYRLWADFSETVRPPPTGNKIYDWISSIFKDNGLWSMQTNHELHPIPALSSLGKSLIDNAIAALGGGAVTGMLKMSGSKAESQGLMGMLAGVLVTFAMICLTAGALMSYVIPFLPFIYFFFGVATWLKTVFELMIGTPLLALSMITLSEPGLFPRRSLYGVQLIFSVFLRPVMLVFGLVASMAVYTAMYRALQDLFTLVTSNLTGFDKSSAIQYSAGQIGALDSLRGPIDQFVFTIIFAVTTYMTALGAFKMIDSFPEQIIRWGGMSARSFINGQNLDPGKVVEGTLKSGLSSAAEGIRRH